MSELILRGLDLFLDKTHSAGKLSISPEITETVFLVLGFLLVFAGAKMYRVVISLVMFIGITLLFCTLLDGRGGASDLREDGRVYEKLHVLELSIEEKGDGEAEGVRPAGPFGV